MAVYGPVRHQTNIIWTEARSSKKYYMDRSFWGPYNIFLVTDRSIYCHMTLSAMNYLLCILLLPLFNIYCYRWIKFLIYLNLHDYWFYNGFEYYSICHLNWHGSGYNIFSENIYLPVNCIYKIFSGWVGWFINQRRKWYYIP